MQLINPATGELIQEYQPYSDNKAASIIDKSHKAFLDWHFTDMSEREQLMLKLTRITFKDWR